MKEIVVKGTLRHEILVNPLDVIQQLKIEALQGHRNWVEELNGKYFIMCEDHKMDREVKEIFKEEYDYIQHLNEIYKYLNNGVY